MITRRLLLGFFAAATLAPPAFARPVRVSLKDGYALCGYDPVAYFQEGQAVLGTAAYRLHWANAVWQFSSAENLAAFERNPNAFAPQYGGYCAMALTAGRLVDADPASWAVHDGKLYLTHTLSARENWLSDPDLRITQATAYWSDVF